MRHEYFVAKSIVNSNRGKISQQVKANTRLAEALEYGPIRKRGSYLVLEINTHNPSTGTKHNIELRHEMSNGNNRYNVYLDGKKLRNQWSRTSFVKWLFKQIDSVRSDMVY